MLLVGAAGRSAGKTRLVCDIIERYSREIPIIGIKVTPVEAREEGCPRGGAGCGACDELAADIDIREERARDPAKDTGRMLLAGAARALWVRARRNSLAQVPAALAGEIGEGAIAVCESTSLRAAAVPDLFLLARREGSAELKDSARELSPHADRVVAFDGECFDLPLDDLGVRGGRWVLRSEATAVIMAGGESSRMGRDKALLEVEGRTLIERIVERLRPHFRELVVSAADPGRYDFLDLPVIRDRERGRGPLMGIASALAASMRDPAFVHACDIPETNVDLMLSLLRASRDADIAVPRRPDGRCEPLFAAYRKSAIPHLEAVLAEGESAVRAAFDRCRTAYVEVASGGVRNLNTMEDYHSYLGISGS